MHLISNVLHDIRYKFNYFYIDLKQRYYSTSFSSRSYKAKPTSQKTFTLRRLVHQDHEPNSVEFIASDEKLIETNFENTILKTPNGSLSEILSTFSGYYDFMFEDDKQQTINKNLQLKLENDSTVFFNDNDLNNLNLQQNTSSDNKKNEDFSLESSNISLFQNKNLHSKHISNNLNDLLNTYSNSQESVKKKKRHEMHVSIPSPIIELNSSISNPSELNNKKSQTLFNFTKKKVEPSIITSTPVTDKQIKKLSNRMIKKLHLLNSTKRVSSFNSFIRDNYNNNSMLSKQSKSSPQLEKNQEAWKTIFNEVSLSAARISTNHFSKSISEPKTSNINVLSINSTFNDENQQSLFTSEKNSEKKLSVLNNTSEKTVGDLFAENLRQGKLRFTKEVNVIENNNLKNNSKDTGVYQINENTKRSLSLDYYSKPKSIENVQSDYCIFSYYNYESDISR